MMEDGDGSHVRSCNKQAWLDSKISIVNCERAVWRLADDYLEAWMNAARPRQPRIHHGGPRRPTVQRKRYRLCCYRHIASLENAEC